MADTKQLYYGSPVPTILSGTPAFTAQNLDSSLDQAEVICQAQEAATITRLGMRVNSITGTTPTYKISLQGVGADGNPDGTIKGGGSPASATFNPSSSGWVAGEWHWINLDNSYTCSRGERLAWVIAYETGTISVLNFLAASVSSNFFVFGHPYAIANEATVRTRSTGLPIFGYGSSSKAYGFPLENISSLSFNSGSAADEYAIRFGPSADIGSSYNVAGFRIPLAFATANVNVIFTLYDGTTPLQQLTEDTDVFQALSGFRPGQFLFQEATLSNLAYGSTYRLGIAPQTANNTSVITMTVDAVADWEAWPGGQEVYLSSRVDGGAWTDDSTRKIIGDLIITDIIEGSPGLHFGGGFN